jgi:hypothetical protein
VNQPTRPGTSPFEGKVVSVAPTDQDEVAKQPGTRGRWPRWIVAIGRNWRDIGWFSLGVGFGLVIDWFIFLSDWGAGSKAEWFSGSGAFAAVAVALWQTNKVERQAAEDVKQAAERLRRELAQARHLHQIEMEGQREISSPAA